MGRANPTLLIASFFSLLFSAAINPSNFTSAVTDSLDGKRDVLLFLKKKKKKNYTL